jgi:hypothetical protein
MSKSVGNPEVTFTKKGQDWVVVGPIEALSQDVVIIATRRGFSNVGIVDSIVEKWQYNGKTFGMATLVELPSLSPGESAVIADRNKDALEALKNGIKTPPAGEVKVSHTDTAEVEALKSQVESMKAMMTQFLSLQGASAPTVEVAPVATHTGPGRPKDNWSAWTSRLESLAARSICAVCANKSPLSAIPPTKVNGSAVMACKPCHTLASPDIKSGIRQRMGEFDTLV